MLAAAAALAMIPAPEAGQGVAADDRHIYAIDNNRIAKYDKRTGQRVAEWSGDRARFPHINSCAADGADLVCAASNYPAVPQESMVEIFDRRTLKHRRTVRLGQLEGSLTVLDRHGGNWWAVLANYDGRGGAPGRDHRATRLVRMDARFRPLQNWTFPDAVLARFAPKSCSGAAWARDGLLYASGHDRPEIYALRLPRAGMVLEHVATLPVSTPGQAIDWDPAGRMLWSIDRAQKRVVATAVPPVR
jgi:hypothetical protein